MRTKEFLDKLEHDRIVRAIQEAETKTSGRVAVHIHRGNLRTDALLAGQKQFRKIGLDKTKSRNGILIFVAPRARKFAVVGDKGIHEKCGDEFWQGVVAKMRHHFAREGFSHGIAESVLEIGDVLAKHFPRVEDTDKQPNDENVLGKQQSTESLFVAPLSDRPDLRSALKRPKRWRLIYRTMQIGSAVSAFTFFCLIYSEHKRDQTQVNRMLQQGQIDSEAYDLAQYYSSKSTINETILKKYGLSKNLEFSTVCAWIFLLFFLPSIKAGIWLWPTRILLLRPFGTQQVSQGLKKFVRCNVAFSGHVFTLADQYMKESLLLYLLECLPKSEGELIALFTGNRHRRIVVKKESDFRRLKRRLSKRFLLNSFWVTSWDKIRKIRTADAWWQRCIDLLSAACDVILVDLTVVKAGTHWELAKISEENLVSRTIFVAYEQTLARAAEILRGYYPGESLPVIFTYNRSGSLQDKDSFDQRLAEILSSPRSK